MKVKHQQWKNFLRKQSLCALVMGALLISVSGSLYAESVETSIKRIAPEGIAISKVVKSKKGYIVYGTSESFIAMEKLRNETKNEGIGEPYLDLLGKQKDTKLHQFKMEVRL